MSSRKYKAMEKKFGVPRPKSGRKTKWGFELLKVGDSRRYPVSEKDRLAVAASKYASRRGQKVQFTLRTSGGYVEMWRVK